MSSGIGLKKDTLFERIQRNNRECDQVYASFITFLLFLTYVYIYLIRIRSARIKNILDNCLATNDIGQMIPKVELREEVEWYVDTYPGFPERSMRTGEYLYPLGPDPIDAPKPDAALADFRNVDHAETWGVPNSTK